jgi:hypothetical protein
MKRSAVALISAITLLALHGAQVLWGGRGVIGFVAAVGIFFFVARALYWRRLRRVRETTRNLTREERSLMYTFAGFDAEARRDMEKLARDERKDPRHRS